MLNRILWRTFVEQKHVGLLTKYNTLVKAVEAQQKQIELLKSKVRVKVYR